MIKQAMILAAGLGSRMKELTKDIPKPMISVNGISLIERHLQYLLKNKITKVVINTYYKAQVFEDFLRSSPISKELNLIFSREEELLGTAGGIKNALSSLGNEPFFVINSDSIFIDNDLVGSAFAQLETAWKPSFMPMMLLLSEKSKSFGYWLKGDFDIDNAGKLNQANEVRQFINPGMYIMDYKLFQDYPEKILQFYPRIFQDLMKANQLYGCVYNGDWLHIGDLKAYNDYMTLTNKL